MTRSAILRSFGLSGVALLAGCASGARSLLPDPQDPNKRAIVCPEITQGCNAGPGTGTLPQDLSRLTVAQIQALTNSQVYGLNDTQIGSVTNTQLAVFTSTQCATFHGLQANAILSRAAAAQNGAPPPPTLSNPPPPTYTPATPGSGFWSWLAGTVCGIAGGAIGGQVSDNNPIAVNFGSILLGTFCGGLGGPTDAQFNFWDSNTGSWQSVDVSLSPQQQQLDSDGYTVSGSLDASTNTVQITVIGN